MNTIKSFVKNTLLKTAENIGLLDILQKISIRNGQSVYILSYHRVTEYDSRPWLVPGLISATPQQFEEQMKLVATKYNPISIQDLIDAAHGRISIPKDAVLITVDDGYRDFMEEIFPICARHGIQPLLFMPTAFVGSGNFWWDKVYQIIYFSGQNQIETPIGTFSIATDIEKSALLEQLTQALKKMPFETMTEWVDPTHLALVQLTEEQRHNTLSWDELRKLSTSGATVACHTHTHPIMTRISIETARQQVRKSQEIIQHELGYSLPIFAFPDGGREAFSSDLFEMLHNESFEMLFLLVGGRAFIQPQNNKMVFPRLSVWQSQTISQFHLRLTPFWTFYETITYQIRKTLFLKIS